MNETMNELLGKPSPSAQSLFDLNAAATLAVSVWRANGGAMFGAALVMGNPQWERYAVSPKNGGWVKLDDSAPPPDDVTMFVSLDGVAALQAAAYLGVSE